MPDPTKIQSSPADADPTTIAGFQTLIRRRYFATDSARGAPGTFLYFMEEVGELATALAAHNRAGKPATEAERANLEEEFADVLAWLATLANIHSVDLARAVGKYAEPGRVEGVKD
jgi:NTP pyrophosphatase (non-canonical NTP hydrolase)